MPIVEVVRETGGITRDRGCGRRIAGGMYWETHLEPGGENFIVDAPVPIDANAIGLASVGQKYIQRNGVWHLLDWIGEEHYPNVADFIEEARVLGVSRRMSASGNLRALTRDSRLLCVHRKAWIENAEQVQIPVPPGVRRDRAPAPMVRCPLDRREHAAAVLRGSRGWMCCGLWWHDVVGATARTRTPLDESGRAGEPITTLVRTLPCGHSYLAMGHGNVSPPRRHKAAIFASFPLSRTVVINDPVGRRHEATSTRLRLANRPFDLVEA